MLNLTKQQRATLVDKLPDAGNLAVGALFFGQFLNGGRFSPLVALLGVGFWVVLIGWSIFLAGGDKS
jgi:hypothetical protein